MKKYTIPIKDKLVKKRCITSVQFPDKTRIELKELAESLPVSQNDIIVSMVKHCLEELKEQ